MPDLINYIEEVSSKGGETNGKRWTRFVFKIGGNLMSTFDDKYKDFKVGEFVEVVFEEKGKYKNIVSMIKKEEGSVAPTTIKTTSQAGQPYFNSANNYKSRDYDAEEASKVASVILSYCKDLVIADKIEKTKLVDNAILLADAFKEVKKRLLKNDKEQPEEQTE